MDDGVQARSMGEIAEESEVDLLRSVFLEMKKEEPGIQRSLS